MTALLLVDTPVQGDRRVERSLKTLGEQTEIINIKEIGRKGIARLLTMGIPASLLICKCLCVPLSRYRLLAPHLKGRILCNPFAGLLECGWWLTCSLYTARLVRLHLKRYGACTIYAHDLYAAVAVSLVELPEGTHFIYDAHELQIHRNRRAGWLRILIEHALHQDVLRKATEVRIVNQAIADLMAQWYATRASVYVEYNDHYIYHPASVPPATGTPSLVYVGAGTRGRLLEYIDKPASQIGFNVHIYLLDAMEPGISGKHWHFGPIPYEAHLLTHVGAVRSMMWCCQTVRFMNNQLATPNKFFQALALGIPVVAMQESYLADLVKQHGIGAVFDGSNLPGIAQQVMSPLYDEWVANVERFRTRLRSGELAI